jgi:hypothetical protein
MTLNTEALLALLIFALYLKDSLLLLGPDEAVLTTRDGKDWAARYGARTWKIAGREPLFANILLPDQALFRLRWNMALGPKQGKAGRRVAFPPELKRVGRFVWITWLLLFVALPTALIGRLGAVVVICAIGALYASVLASLACVWAARRAIVIEPKAFFVLAFECVACPPYAANLVRRLAAASGIAEDFETAAQRLLDPRRLAQVNAQCLARIDERLEWVEEDSPEFASLTRARRRFLAMANS